MSEAKKEALNKLIAVFDKLSEAHKAFKTSLDGAIKTIESLPKP